MFLPQRRKERKGNKNSKCGSLDEAQRNPGVYSHIKTRIALRCIQVTTTALFIINGFFAAFASLR